MQYIESISKLLIPHKTNFEKIRVGSQVGDGGYIISDIPEYKYGALYSYGCDDAITFENEFYDRYSTESFVYDHTINGITNKPPYIHFCKQGVARVASKDGMLDTMNNHIEANKHGGMDNLFLQMDIEGSEWEVIHSVPDETLLQFSQMCIEFHMWGPQTNLPLFANVFEKIDKNFICTHIHGNNYCIDRYNEIPKVIEISYIRRDLLEYYTIDKQMYPTELDRVNNRMFKDLRLGWWI